MADIEPNLGELSDRELIIVLLTTARGNREAISRLDARIGHLQKAREDEALGCPFYPSREENGHKLIDRVTSIEKQIDAVRNIGYGLFGLGTINLVALVVSWLHLFER